MKDKVFKGKRKRVNWIKVLHKLDRPVLNDYFFTKLSVLHYGRSLSSNRIAYNTLKHFYSTTTIDELLKKLDSDSSNHLIDVNFNNYKNIN